MPVAQTLVKHCATCLEDGRAAASVLAERYMGSGKEDEDFAAVLDRSCNMVGSIRFEDRSEDTYCVAVSQC